MRETSFKYRLADHNKKNHIVKGLGKWIERQNIARLNLETAVGLRWKYECSECGYEVRSKYYYCPSCRIMMIESQAEREGNDKGRSL